MRDTPKRIPGVWLYDAVGSRLFDEITRLPEYYLTRCERELLVARAAEIASLTRAETLVELGSGTSEKTRLLLDALSAEGSLRRFVPFDVSEEVLVASAFEIAEEYPAIEEVHAVVGDFERHLAAVPGGCRRLVAFLGSTIGNLIPEARERFLRSVADALHEGDTLLLGLDLVKDPARIEAAYNDSAGLSENSSEMRFATSTASSARTSRAPGSTTSPRGILTTSGWTSAFARLESRSWGSRVSVSTSSSPTASSCGRR